MDSMSISPRFLVARLDRRHRSHTDIWQGISEAAVAAKEALVRLLHSESPKWDDL